MADHGLNRRRSHYARKKQRKGKHKKVMHTKARTKHLKEWFLYWTGISDRRPDWNEQ